MTKKGVTLVEVIVVLAIITIFLGLGHMGIRAVHEYQEKAFVKELYLDLQHLRQTAILEQKMIYFKITSEKTYQIYESSGKGKIMLDSVELPSSIHFMTSDSIKEIYFGLSFAQVKAGTIRLQSDQGKEYIITIVPVTGRIYLK